MAKIIMSRAEYENLEQKLKILKTKDTDEIAARIAAARSLGDLSENSEYEDAKNAQAFLNGQIAEIEAQLRNAEVQDIVEGSAEGIVSLGARVTLEDTVGAVSFVCTIVGSTEVDPLEMKISGESPIGAAIFGHREGDIVEVATPSGVRIMKIVSVER